MNKSDEFKGLLALFIMFILPIIVLCFGIYGCFKDNAEEHIRYKQIQSTQKYYINDIVYFKLDNRKGIITDYKIKVHDGDIFYKVKLATDKTIGIDTAAGSGLLGNTSHNNPSVYTEVVVRQGELK